MNPDQFDRDSAEELAQAITDLDGVAGLSGGRFGEVAMLFPGGRVRGLHVTSSSDDSGPQRLEVFIVADGSRLSDLTALADKVRTLATGYVDLPVDVTVADVE